jgi:hypothetical protein
MKHLTFSQVKRAHGLLRFLWPVQSWGQAKTMTLIYAVGLPSMALALHLLDPEEPTWGAMLACVVGGTWALFIHLPGTLEVTTRGEARHFVGEVSDLLRRYGYCGEPCGQHCVRFTGRVSPRLHWLPNWLRWKETEIDLAAQDHVIVLRGPKFVLRHLRQRWILEVV